MIPDKQKIILKIENLLMIVNKHLQINQILALNSPYGVDMPLNK